jgi:hypothetical protein
VGGIIIFIFLPFFFFFFRETLFLLKSNSNSHLTVLLWVLTRMFDRGDSRGIVERPCREMQSGVGWVFQPSSGRNQASCETRRKKWNSKANERKW